MIDRRVRHLRPVAGPARVRSQRGAALVEFALVAPLLFGLLFGIVDFGYAYSRTLDVRHGARGAARMASVNYSGGTSSTGSAQRGVIINETCRRMDGGKGATISLAFAAATSGAAPGDVGQAITTTVQRPLTSLSGIYRPLLNNKQITSTVRQRIEVKPTWTGGSGSCS